jgi:divalent metal cation (Fe/Co/Zn/Cd) transporter
VRRPGLPAVIAELLADATARYGRLVGSVALFAAALDPKVDAYASGVRAALAMGGLIAIVGGAIAWVFLGRRDPLATVYEHRDEREAHAG